MKEYTVEMNECNGGEGSLTFSAADDAAAEREAKRLLEEWVQEGDYQADDPAECRVGAWYVLLDAAGEEIARGEMEVIIPADEDRLMAAADAPDCDHEWTSAGEWLLGGTTVRVHQYCRLCGLEREETRHGNQRNPGQADELTFSVPARWCAECETSGECEHSPD